ncbi:sapecin-B-like [Sergentomyia squamirostris]
MKFVKVCLILIFLAAVVMADTAMDKEDELEDNYVEDVPVIEPRITCDLLSPTGWSDALCATNCIRKGFKGGYCDSRKVCRCRR